MPYTAEISRQQPTCFLFLVDQSGSMADSFGGESQKRKADGVADAINRLLRELSLRCARAEGVRPYFHVGVIGYGAQVGPAFCGALAGKELVTIADVANSPARLEERSKKVDDGAGGLVDQTVKFPVWFDAVANGGTPMCQALKTAAGILRGFLDKYPGCFPPVVIQLSDGEPTDGDPSSAMRDITSLSSSDGNILLFNCHMSSKAEKPIAFPHTSESLPDEHAKLLFDGSSELTPFMRQIAKEHGLTLQDGARGFTFNADLTLVIQALDIGTRTSDLR
jgi:hypothetical protein